ncbi:MAG: KDO2-lipid IV(A) lauroyltransferase [Planctomycetota bacterium]|jgi:KDO2-lipid IV(A) lauroyltransferase
MSSEPLRRRLRARAVNGFAKLANRLPAFSVRAPLGALARLASFSKVQTLTLANLELALGSETTLAERKRIAAGVRAHSANLLYEWARLTPGPAQLDWLNQNVEIDESVRILEEQTQLGRGVILVTAHIGNWEMLAIALRARGFEGTVVGRKRARDSGSNFLVDLRAAWGLDSLPQDCAAREPLRVLQSGAILGLLTDLEVRRIDGEFLPFFGVDALCMTAPAALARAAQLPLLPVRCIREKGATSKTPYRLSFEPPLALNTDLPRDAACTDLTNRLNSVYERWIRETPEQWAWHQPRWRTRPGSRKIQPWASHKHGSTSTGGASSGESSSPNS